MDVGLEQFLSGWPHNNYWNSSVLADAKFRQIRRVGGRDRGNAWFRIEKFFWEDRKVRNYFARRSFITFLSSGSQT